jgi:hypothetical protein
MKKSDRGNIERLDRFFDSLHVSVMVGLASSRNQWNRVPSAITKSNVLFWGILEHLCVFLGDFGQFWAILGGFG